MSNQSLSTHPATPTGDALGPLVSAAPNPQGAPLQLTAEQMLHLARSFTAQGFHPVSLTLLRRDGRDVSRGLRAAIERELPDLVDRIDFEPFAVTVITSITLHSDSETATIFRTGRIDGPAVGNTIESALADAEPELATTSVC